MIYDNLHRISDTLHDNTVSYRVLTPLFCRQAVCEWGRDSIESWGRRRRSIQPNAQNNDTASENSEDMTQISQEILVLDFGDEKQSQFLKSNEPQYTDFNKGTNCGHWTLTVIPVYGIRITGIPSFFFFHRYTENTKKIERTGNIVINNTTLFRIFLNGTKFPKNFDLKSLSCVILFY